MMRTVFAACLLAFTGVACGNAAQPDVVTGDDAAADVSAPPMDASPGDAGDADTGPVVPPPDSGAEADADAAETGNVPDASEAGCTDDNGCPAGSLCASGACVPGCTAAHACPSSSVCCTGQCLDVSSDPGNCGACGKACSNNNVPMPTCTAGVCTGTCAPGFADCNANKQTDGCETNTQGDVANCGGCSVVCSSQDITPACSTGICDGTCTLGFADCNANKQTDGCETNTQGDVANCGGCSVVCSSQDITPACSMGICDGTCAPGFADCNSNKQTDGCETNVETDPGNCGGCGARCSANHVPSPACSGGQCDGACAPGWADCNGNLASDGCETNTSTNPADCGACGAVCADTCVAGSCVCRLGLPDAPVLPTLSAPAAVAAADFDRDGRPDLAEISMSPAPGLGGYAVRVFLNQGGAFFTWRDYPTDSGGIALVAADMNGDGYPDLATAEHDAQSVDILINDRHGGFGPATKHVVANQPVDLALVNGELVIVDEYSNSLVTLAGGPGTPTGSEPVAIAAGDVDGDGVQDMAVANLGDNTVSVYASRSGNARTDYPTSTAPLSVAIADLNGDGAPELLVGEGGTYDVRVFVNPGNGKFGTSTTYPTVGAQGRPTRIAVADFNEDGHPDVVTANDFAGNSVTVFLNQGNGTLGIGTPHEASNTPDDGAGLAVGDFQGRGHADIAFAEGTADAVYLFLGDGKGQFTRPPTVATGQGSVAVAVGDVNGDGAPDLVGANYGGQSISVILNAGGRSFQPHTDYAVNDQPDAIALADFNGDGRLDVVVGDANPGDICVLLNTGGGAFGTPAHYLSASSFGAAMTGVATGDVDNDGDIDIVAANSGQGALDVFFNDGHGGFATEVNVSVPTTAGEPSGVALVDANSDGRLDMAVSTSDFLVLLNQGGGTFGPPAAYPSTGYMQAIGTGDLDGDGRVDLVGIGGNTPGFVAVLLAGPTGFSNAVSYDITQLPANVFVADVDGDGLRDVVAASQNDDIGVVSVLRNTGGGILARQDYSTPFGASGVAARDLDGDGHTDVVATIDYNGGSGMYLLYGGCL